MSWQCCAFSTHIPFRSGSGRWAVPGASSPHVHKRRVRVFRPCRRPTNCRPRAALGPPDIPPDVTELDELERERRENLASEPPPPCLSDETEALLFRTHPHLKELDDKMKRVMQQDDYDPEDHRVYSWAYEKMRPWAPSRFLQIATVLLACFSVRNLWRAAQARASLPVIITTLMRLEALFNIVLLLIFPIIICTWAIAISRTDFRTDGVRRMAIMHTLSSMMLLPVSAVASVGHPVAAATAGVFVRLSQMFFALWYWRDLRREAFLGTALLARVFRIWRFLTTTFIIFGGCGFRAFGLFREHQFPSVSAMAASSEKLRIRLGKNFPVSFSLCNDPRGLFFAACLALAAGFLYCIYVAVFVTDFGRIKNHRKTNAILSTLLLQADVYRPNEHPLKKTNGLTCPDTEKSFLPSRAMMLKRQDDLITIDSSYLSSDMAMPIFSFLDKEDEISGQEGAEQWMKPRDEQIPLSENLSRLERTTEALKSWARPLDEKEGDMSFAEFFETLEDDEYRYDPDSGNWVFSDEALSKEQDNTHSKILEDIMNAKDETEISTADLEKVIRELGDVDLGSLASSPELDALWQHKNSDENRQKGDDSDDPSVTVFV